LILSSYWSGLESRGDNILVQIALDRVEVSLNDGGRHPRHADRYPEGGQLILLACESKLAGAAGKSTAIALCKAVELTEYALIRDRILNTVLALLTLYFPE
jgi:hypothetical protein